MLSPPMGGVLGKNGLTEVTFGSLLFGTVFIMSDRRKQGIIAMNTVVYLIILALFIVSIIMDSWLNPEG